MFTDKTLFVTGIDTDAGKSYATGWLARMMMNEGKNVITQKFIQTGNKEFSEDIAVHRKLMGIDLTPRDMDHTTAPVILSYPASADLAARIDGVEIDFSKIENATSVLEKEYDHVLIEGAGGLMAPLKGDYLTLDYLRDHGLPTIVVTNSKLGSINHTLLTLEALKRERIKVAAVIYNAWFDESPWISADTREYIRNRVEKFFPSTQFIEMPRDIF